MLFFWFNMGRRVDSHFPRYRVISYQSISSLSESVEFAAAGCHSTKTFCFPGGRLLLRGPGHSPVVRAPQNCRVPLAVCRWVFLKLCGPKECTEQDRLLEAPKVSPCWFSVPNPVKQAGNPASVLLRIVESFQTTGYPGYVFNRS